jgi:hypothetical protein
MNKAVKQSYKGMSQDISKSKSSPEFYFEGKNIRVVATDSQSTGSVSNEKGNKLIYQIPTPVINYTTKVITYGSKTLSYTTTDINYGPAQSADQVILGFANTRDYVILFTTDSNGFDCIWKIRYNDYDITLLYLRNLNFSTNNPIQVLNNFENASIDKVYWIDGKSQVRFLNINHSIANGDLEALIDVPVTTIDMVGKYILKQPLIKEILSGSKHTSGRIQYAYNLYRLNSTQTKLSPLSKMISLDKGNLGGGIVNEIVGALPVIEINNLDTTFTNIKVYAIKYTSLNETPSIYLIDDREIPKNGNVEIFDDGSTISTLSLEEFIFLGSDIIIPKHINNKDNRLLFANYNEVNFEILLDTRAYSFNSSGTCTVFEDIRLYETGDTTPNINGITGIPTNITGPLFANGLKHDSINLDFDTYKFHLNGTTRGGEGRYLKYELTQTQDYDSSAQYFKDDEIYRIGIQFYNNYGQITLPNWIGDFRSTNGNLEGNYNTLKFAFKSEFYTWLNTYSFENDYQKPVGYKVLIAERTLNDKTIIASGVLSTMMAHDRSSRDVRYPADQTYIQNRVEELPKLPNFLIRNCMFNTAIIPMTAPLRVTNHLAEMNQTPGGGSVYSEILRADAGDVDTAGRFYQFNPMLQLYSPEILFKESFALSNSLKLRVKGALKNKYNGMWARRYGTTNSDIVHEGKIKNGLSPAWSSEVESIVGNGYYPLDRGLIAHPGGEEANRVLHWLAYRVYGDVEVKDIIVDNDCFALQSDFLIVDHSPEPPITEAKMNLIDANTNVLVGLSLNYPTAEITYTITPDTDFTTVPYSVSGSSNAAGTDLYSGGLIATTGTQTITVTHTPDPLLLSTTTTLDISNYLILLSNVLFKAFVDITVKIYDDSVTPVIRIERETLFLDNYFDNTGKITTSTSFFTPAPTLVDYNIYGTPELTEKGQNFKTYNNDTKYRYSNSLQSFYSDGNKTWDDKGKYNRKVVSINSDNNRCITLVTGDDDSSLLNTQRPSIEELYTDLGFTDDNNVLIGELVRPHDEIYLGNIYGGNTWEDKHRANYLEVGEYIPLTNTSDNIINSPGDTYVNNFKFLRIVRKDSGIIEEGIPQIEELVEYITETTVDLKNRADLSLNLWDDKFQYSDADYHNYNRVYSQTPNLIRRTNTLYTFKKINSYDTNIIASKLKSSGELIDSWTDILQNEVITLDGKYGAINSLANFNDEIYAIQDRAFAFISVNPRVQIQGNDGLGVELGTGGVLSDYKYITTDSGTLNKWSTVASTQGLYFYDTLNRSFNIFRGNVIGLSDSKALHTYFTNNTVLNDLKLDNHILGTGISSGYDYINNEVLMTFHQDSKPSFTIAYNESQQMFTSFYDYTPSFYISRGLYYITTDPTNKKLYRQFEGQYNTFYDVKYPSYVTLNVNPAADFDCVFDNINFKSEVYSYDALTGLYTIDNPDKTLTGIRAYTDHLDSNTGTAVTPLISGRNNNLRRKFRDWNALIPRAGRQRIRGPWIKLKLVFDQQGDYKFILHDTNIFYTI